MPETITETATEAAPAKHTASLGTDKGTILINVENGIKDLITALAKKTKIEDCDISEEEFKHLPNSQTGVVVYLLSKALKEEFDIAFDGEPVSLKIRGNAAMDKKVAGKKRLLTRDQKNHILEKMQMSYYEKDIASGKINIEEAMTSIKAAYEEKSEFEKMGYMLPQGLTKYPYWETDEEEGDKE